MAERAGCASSLVVDMPLRPGAAESGRCEIGGEGVDFVVLHEGAGAVAAGAWAGGAAAATPQDRGMRIVGDGWVVSTTTAPVLDRVSRALTADHI